MKIRHTVTIRPDAVFLDGVSLPVEGRGMDLLTDLYRTYMKDYPKFFKMDLLSRLGVLATELLVRDEAGRFSPREDRAVLLFSRSGPLCNDGNYQKTIGADDYFPSPALFVYTLANIVTGEIAIRNKYAGDTTAYELPEFSEAPFVSAVRAAFEDRVTTSAVCGWAEALDPDHFEAVLLLVEQDAPDGLPFDEETIQNLKLQLK